MANVYFVAVSPQASDQELADAAEALFEAAKLGVRFERRDLVAIKSHFGEMGNSNVVPPLALRTIGSCVKKHGGRPFLVETSTLYTGARSDAVAHLQTAHRNGFGFDAVEMPLLMADGLNGDAEIEVTLDDGAPPVALARDAVLADALLVVSHVTGHLATGFGAALKNIGMGLASRRGKLRQHSAMKPAIEEARCTACGRCIPWCPEHAIALVEGPSEHAQIDSVRCIGCGECLTICREDAVTFDWHVESGELQRRMVDHAAALVRQFPERTAYVNFLVRITKDCDCLGKSRPPIAPDIGVLASTDLVAIETATLDLFAERVGKPLEDLAYPNLDPRIQIEHATRRGLGDSSYTLVEVEHISKLV